MLGQFAMWSPRLDVGCLGSLGVEISKGCRWDRVV